MIIGEVINKNTQTYLRRDEEEKKTANNVGLVRTSVNFRNYNRDSKETWKEKQEPKKNGEKNRGIEQSKR